MVIVVDYGLGNLPSVRRALEECGAEVQVSSRPEDILSCSHIVLPGVGSFADGIRNLREKGWAEALVQAAHNNTKVLGICLGMQLLADSGTEGGEASGLGLIPGRVLRLQATDDEPRIPHVGWNEIHLRGVHRIFSEIDDHTDFYFVHSYHFLADNQDNVLATTPYCGGFTSVIGKGNIVGVQFHPEKSSKIGFRLLRNFLEF